MAPGPTPTPKKNPGDLNNFLLGKYNILSVYHSFETLVHTQILIFFYFFFAAGEGVRGVTVLWFLPDCFHNFEHLLLVVCKSTTKLVQILTILLAQILDRLTLYSCCVMHNSA